MDRRLPLRRADRVPDSARIIARERRLHLRVLIRRVYLNDARVKDRARLDEDGQGGIGDRATRIDFERGRAGGDRHLVEQIN